METLLKGSDFISDCVHLLYYKCHKINLKRGRPYIDSPDWIKDKKAIISRINKKDNKYFKYVMAVALNHEERERERERVKHPERFKKKLFFL